MINRILLASLLLASAAPALGAGPLVGIWTREGAEPAELRDDGTGLIGSDEVRWKADARSLTFTYEDGRREAMSYTLAGNQLSIIIDGKSEVYRREAKKPAPKAGKDRISTLLLSSAWCSFVYNKTSGASRQERVVFRADGTWRSTARAETHSSGPNGAAAGQSDTASGGRWTVKGTSLLMSTDDGALEDAGLSISKNSGGHPILKSGGKEYSGCR